MAVPEATGEVGAAAVSAAEPVDVTVIIPARNSNPDILRTFDLIRQGLDGHSFEVLVVVEDRMPGPVLSDTRTYATMTDTRFQAHPLNGDKAAAVRYGMEQARGRVVGFMDVDMGIEAEPEHLRTIAEAVLNGETDCAIPDRDQREWAWIRKAKTNYFAAAARWLFRLPVRDTQGAMKFMSADAAGTALRFCAFKGWEFDVELLWVLKITGFRIRPYPVWWVGRGGEVPWVSALLILTMGTGMVKNLVAVRLRTLFTRRRILRAWRATLPVA
ncbi:glycosyltransferase [Streptacidiphilus sp. EB129]|uniref:glycosyltransferase n=1 Tax=Streptacidiphilus sp. EB129 TaxID=3156262 RepID=UPI0035170496